MGVHAVKVNTVSDYPVLFPICTFYLHLGLSFFPAAQGFVLKFWYNLQRLQCYQ